MINYYKTEILNFVIIKHTGNLRAEWCKHFDFTKILNRIYGKYLSIFYSIYDKNLTIL